VWADWAAAETPAGLFWMESTRSLDGRELACRPIGPNPSPDDPPQLQWSV